MSIRPLRTIVHTSADICAHCPEPVLRPEIWLTLWPLEPATVAASDQSLPRARYEGYFDGLRDVGLPHRPELALFPDENLPPAADISRLLAPTGKTAAPDAVAAARGELAVSASHVTHGHGLEIGTDLALTGFDDTPGHFRAGHPTDHRPPATTFPACVTAKKSGVWLRHFPAVRNRIRNGCDSTSTKSPAKSRATNS